MIEDDLGDQIPKIEDGPWPAFPADLTSIALAVATQARGTVLIFEKMFENRLFFVDKLVSMGARIILCDPHRAVVTGPAKLYGQRMASPDIRAGMAMLIASLCAEGSRRSETSARSTAATSGSTSACAPSARGSTAPRASGPLEHEAAGSGRRQLGSAGVLDAQHVAAGAQARLQDDAPAGLRAGPRDAMPAAVPPDLQRDAPSRR